MQGMREVDELHYLPERGLFARRLGNSGRWALWAQSSGWLACVWVVCSPELGKELDTRFPLEEGHA